MDTTTGTTVTVKDVARRAAVSTGTVSRVLQNQKNVSDDIRSRVLQAIEDLGYQNKKFGNQGIAHLQHRPIKNIGFLYCSVVDHTAAIHNPFWSHILHGAEREAQKDDVRITYTSISHLLSTPLALISTIQAMKLDGILLVGPAEGEVVKHLQGLGIPLVLVDNHLPNLSVDSILCDNFEGARLAVRYLIEQGHRHIAFIGGPFVETSLPVNSIYSLELRASGYRAALWEAGIPVDDRLIEESQLNPPSGGAACQRLLDHHYPFTAVFCANDEIAIGVVKTLQSAGKRVPLDVSVVGFDDIALVEHMTPALTTVHVDKEALGALAVKHLLLRTENTPMFSISSILGVELIKRETVTSPPSHEFV